MSDPDRLAKVMTTSFWCPNVWDRMSEAGRDGCRKAASAVLRAALEDMGVEEVLRDAQLALESVILDDETKKAGLWQGEMLPRIEASVRSLLTRIKAAKEGR